MTRYRGRTLEIRQFILDNIAKHPKDITALTIQKFDISRPAALRHIRNLISDGLLEAEGKTRDRQYKLKPLVRFVTSLEITPELEEDRVWRRQFLPLLNGVPANVLAICQYGFTEMLNNAIDHSGSDSVFVELERTAADISITVADSGVGIFRKIQTELGLEDPRHVVLELSKGKLTTDPAGHTGEGIFFTARAFDSFAILSGGLFFRRDNPGDEWLLETDDVGEKTFATFVILQIGVHSSRRLRAVFDEFAAPEDDYRFSRTIVPVFLAKYGGENLISRSQAKRLLARVDKFREVILDFEGIDTIGQAFADEVFRVYPKQHPHVHLVPVHATKQVLGMILRAMDGVEGTSRPCDLSS